MITRYILSTDLTFSTFANSCEDCYIELYLVFHVNIFQWAKLSATPRVGNGPHNLRYLTLLVLPCFKNIVLASFNCV